MSKRDVSPKIKEPRKQSKKPKNRFFYRKKQNQDQSENGCSMLCIKKNQYTHLYCYVISMFHEKKIKLKIRNRKSLIVHHPKTDRKNNPNPWIRTTPSITVFLFVDVSFSPKKIPSCTLTKRNECTHTHYQKCRAKSIIIHAVP